MYGTLSMKAFIGILQRHVEPANPINATKYCQSIGYRLLTIDSEEEDKLVPSVDDDQDSGYVCYNKNAFQ